VHHAAERLGTRVEQCSSSVVLEPGEQVPLARVELALEEDVPDHSGVTGDRLVREECGSGEEGAVSRPVTAPEELVAAADGQHRDAALPRLPDRFGLRDQVGCDESLLAILAAADVQEVERGGIEGVSETDCRQDELVPPERCAPREDRDVAAIRVDVEVLGVEVADPNPHGRASSQ